MWRTSISNLLVLVVVAAGCMPPPVRAVDSWWKAYAEGDRPRLFDLTAPQDRRLLKAALDAPMGDMLAMLLPAHPIGHAIDGIAHREPGRWVVDVTVQMANPLPSAARRIGSPMPGIPETRRQRQRVLVVRVGEGGQDRWLVQLDLSQVWVRAQFGDAVLQQLSQDLVEAAERRLQAGVPKPPDNGQPSSPDYLERELWDYVAEAQKRQAGQ